MEIKYKIKGLMLGPNTRQMKAEKIKINGDKIVIEQKEKTIETRMRFLYDIEITK